MNLRYSQSFWMPSSFVRSAERSEAKNSPPENPIMPEAERTASGFFYLPIIAAKEAVCIQRIMIICQHGCFID